MRFSITNQALYASDLEFGTSLPSDVVEITKDEADLLYLAVNSGCYVYAVDGVLTASIARPDKYHSWDSEKNCWVMTDEAAAQKSQDAVALAGQQKTTLRLVADAEIEWRQDAVGAGIATEEETVALAEWKKYRVLLMRVDTAAPDWPTPPATQAS
ncbi:tail fiber assembly protein [Kluyvera ascorbata]|nr:tail fiber assembly protein [Kluyvera ascorbata]